MPPKNQPPPQTPGGRRSGLRSQGSINVNMSDYTATQTPRTGRRGSRTDSQSSSNPSQTAATTSQAAQTSQLQQNPQTSQVGQTSQSTPASGHPQTLQTSQAPPTSQAARALQAAQTSQTPHNAQSHQSAQTAQTPQTFQTPQVSWTPQTSGGRAALQALVEAMAAHPEEVARIAQAVRAADNPPPRFSTSAAAQAFQIPIVRRPPRAAYNPLSTLPYVQAFENLQAPVVRQPSQTPQTPQLSQGFRPALSPRTLQTPHALQNLDTIPEADTPVESIEDPDSFVVDTSDDSDEDPDSFVVVTSNDSDDVYHRPLDVHADLIRPFDPHPDARRSHTAGARVAPYLTTNGSSRSPEIGSGMPTSGMRRFPRREINSAPPRYSPWSGSRRSSYHTPLLGRSKSPSSSPDPDPGADSEAGGPLPRALRRLWLVIALALLLVALQICSIGELCEENMLGVIFHTIRMYYISYFCLFVANCMTILGIVDIIVGLWRVVRRYRVRAVRRTGRNLDRHLLIGLGNSIWHRVMEPLLILMLMFGLQDVEIFTSHSYFGEVSVPIRLVCINGFLRFLIWWCQRVERAYVPRRWRSHLRRPLVFAVLVVLAVYAIHRRVAQGSNTDNSIRGSARQDMIVDGAGGVPQSLAVSIIRVTRNVVTKWVQPTHTA